MLKFIANHSHGCQPTLSRVRGQFPTADTLCRHDLTSSCDTPHIGWLSKLSLGDAGQRRIALTLANTLRQYDRAQEANPPRIGVWSLGVAQGDGRRKESRPPRDVH